MVPAPDSERRPRSRHTAPSALVLGLLLVIAGSPLLARGEWYDHYENALEALEQGEPTRAIDLLQAAVSRKKRSGYLRTYGNNYVRYVPHFYLGVAHNDAGDCERALTSFERSDAVKETAAVPALASTLHSLRTACEARLRPPPEPLPPLPTDEVIADGEVGIDRTAIETTATSSVPAPTPPRCAVAADTLENGLGAYLEGNIDESVRVFDGLVGEAPECSRLRLLLGMALHAAWVLGGQSDDGLLERSRAELAEARKLDDGLVMDPALYPPRVVALYRTLR